MDRIWTDKCYYNYILPANQIYQIKHFSPNFCNSQLKSTGSTKNQGSGDSRDCNVDVQNYKLKHGARNLMDLVIQEIAMWMW